MSSSVLRRALPLVAALTFVAAPVAWADHSESDYVASDTVTKVFSDRLPGDGVGARLVGSYLYVTSTKGLTIYDIKTDPAHPQKVGSETMDVQWENEEVPTNGKVLGISGTTTCPDPLSMNLFNTSGNGTGAGSSGATGCLTLWNVSNPANVTRITTVSGAGQHTTACALDCTWLYGSIGAITDNRDPAHAKIVGDWEKSDWNKNPDGSTKLSSCHHLREIAPGVILGSCQPFILMSIRPEDGGTPLKPVLLAEGKNEDNRFIHSSQWPREGKDKFVLVGGETNASPTCSDTSGAFMVWDASGVGDGKGGFKKGGTFKELSEVRPTNGTYSDGHSPYNALGCSVHWFEQHPSFHDGGLVALAEYENGTRFEQITPEGKIVEKAYFLPLGGSTSAPHWNPYDPTILYVLDYARGLDVLKYTGDTFVPPAPPATQGASTKAKPKPKKTHKAKHKKKPAKKHKKKHKTKKKKH
jgi:hypothetical protein